MEKTAAQKIMGFTPEYKIVERKHNMGFDVLALGLDGEWNQAAISLDTREEAEAFIVEDRAQFEKKRDELKKMFGPYFGK